MDAPFMPGGTFKSAQQGEEIIQMAGTASKFGKLQAAARFGIAAYDNLRNVVKGTGLHVHHLLEQRFAKILGVNAKKCSRL